MPKSARYCFIAIMLLAALGLSPFRRLQVEGESMTPTLQDGQWLLLDTQYYKLTGGPERGDIVVLRHNGERWIKRLVGLPGDRIQIEYREYGLIKQVTNLTTNPDAELKRRANVETLTVPPGEIFIVGDNLNEAASSLTEGQGGFRLSDIQGIARNRRLGRRF